MTVCTGLSRLVVATAAVVTTGFSPTVASRRCVLSQPCASELHGAQVLGAVTVQRQRQGEVRVGVLWLSLPQVWCRRLAETTPPSLTLPEPFSVVVVTVYAAQLVCEVLLRVANAAGGRSVPAAAVEARAAASTGGALPCVQQGDPVGPGEGEGPGPRVQNSRLPSLRILTAWTSHRRRDPPSPWAATVCW